MKYFLLCNLFISSIIIMTSSSLAAGKFGSKEEAVAMVNQVVQMYNTAGAEKTFEAIKAKKFLDRDLYPFVINMRAVMVVHTRAQAMNGKDTWLLPDADGKYIGQEMIKILKTRNTGWFNYKWPNPITRKVDRKVSYIRKLGNEYIVGVGVYLGSEDVR
ncbi:MAG: cache domain-containing protein [Methyloligellaceae bacterium]